MILAEPVGSCTDLVATVIRPLAEVYRQPFDMKPYGVIIKPSPWPADSQGAGEVRVLSESGVHFREADRRGGLRCDQPDR